MLRKQNEVYNFIVEELKNQFFWLVWGSSFDQPRFYGALEALIADQHTLWKIMDVVREINKKSLMNRDIFLDDHGVIRSEASIVAKSKLKEQFENYRKDSEYNFEMVDQKESKRIVKLLTKLGVFE